MMYPWYRDSVGQFCGAASPIPTIKTENGYSDCMLALDYASQSKVSDFIPWSYFYSNLKPPLNNLSLATVNEMKGSLSARDNYVRNLDSR